MVRRSRVAGDAHLLVRYAITPSLTVPPRAHLSSSVWTKAIWHYFFGNLTSHTDETPTVARKQRTNLSARISRLDEMIRHPEEYEQILNLEQSRLPESEQHAHDAEQPDKKIDPGHLFLSGNGKATYVSPAFFAMIRTEVGEINSLLQSQQRYSTMHVRELPFRDARTSGAVSVAPSEGSNHTERKFCGEIFPPAPAFGDSSRRSGLLTSSADIDELVDGLPTKPQCDVLIQAYLTGYHSISPMFHGPSFLQRVSSLFRS